MPGVLNFLLWVLDWGGRFLAVAAAIAAVYYIGYKLGFASLKSATALADAGKGVSWDSIKIQVFPFLGLILICAIILGVGVAVALNWGDWVMPFVKSILGEGFGQLG